MATSATLITETADAATTRAVLEKNLAALSVGSRQVADLIRRTVPRMDVEFIGTDEGVPTAALGLGPSARLLASRRRPREEGARLSETIAAEEAGAAVVLGFGLGYHVEALARRLGRAGVVYVLEPDTALLRAVFERVDHSAWMRATNLVILTDPDDGAALSAATQGVEALLAMGVKFLEHPASMTRLGGASARFKDLVTGVVRATRTTIATTMVNSSITLHNLLMNLDRYAVAPGIGDLRGVAAGRPAVVVSAGPSLRRNIDLLARPGVRDRVVIIAVQTVLKPLLERGIRPHFVTTLDYHEISKRFYEGLTAEMVAGVTLVAEPKANPAILGAFPGTIRCAADGWLDELLGGELARPMGAIRAGATVAHLAYYLARHLGCDPVVMVGQDLGFTDGQYYAAGAAIHSVWAGELNEFRTLEMFEWERIMRGRAHLHRTEDVLGRPIYTDEQMATYRVQFERDFAEDVTRGLRVIDATEGGVRKQHAQTMKLAEALEQYGGVAVLALPEPAGVGGDERARLSRVTERVRSVRAGVWQVAEMSREAAVLLGEMLEHQKDQARIGRLIDKVYALRDRVRTLEPAFGMVDKLNQTGVFKRLRADRDIELDGTVTPLERQKRQIERDIVNVTWLADAADHLGRNMDHAIGVLEGRRARTTREPDPEASEPSGSADAKPAARPAPRRVIAIIPVDPERGGLGTPRRLDEPLALGLNPLALTLRRLARCRELGGVLLLAADPRRALEIAGVGPSGRVEGLEVHAAELDTAKWRPRSEWVRAGRLWSPECWRGGMGNLSCYDELLHPAILVSVMEARGIDAAVLVGPDWAAVDPGLTDAVIDRYRENPTRHRLTFTQAAPGLCGCVIDRTLVHELAARGREAGSFATIGGLLGYIPIAPMHDPIAKPACVAVPAAVRDAQRRLIADTPEGRASLAAAFGALGGDCITAQASAIVGALAAPAGAAEPGGQAPSKPFSAGGAALAVPRHLTLELCTGRRTSGRRAEWRAIAWGGTPEPIERRPLDRSLAARILGELGRSRPDSTVTLAGAGDPLLHPEWAAIVRLARDAGIAGVHVRTDLVCGDDELSAILDSGVDAVSVDLMAESPDVYRTIMGSDLHAAARENLRRLLDLRDARAGAAGGTGATPWVVARMTRCDEAYEEQESFYDRWLMASGAAVIDPPPARVPGQRVEPLPVPAPAAERIAAHRMTVLCDGSVPVHEGDLRCERPIARVGAAPHGESLAEAWSKVRAHARRAADRAGA